MKNLTVLFALLLLSMSAASQYQELEKEIGSIISGRKAGIGVAVGLNRGEDIITINNNDNYPMMSVYKLHLAMAVLNYIEKENLSLNTEIFIKKEDLLPGTYSPMRDKNPEGNYNMAIKKLIKYAIAESDNNACDILFSFVGGTQPVEDYIRSLNIREVSITATEKEMHENIETAYSNWTTPLAAVHLIEILMQQNLFSEEHLSFLIDVMTGTTTGANKIKGHLPADVVVGHKTGSSLRSADGLKIADNDIGFVKLPDGRYYSIAVFVKDSMEDDKMNAVIIAEISRAVYNFLTK